LERVFSKGSYTQSRVLALPRDDEELAQEIDHPQDSSEVEAGAKTTAYLVYIPEDSPGLLSELCRLTSQLFHPE
jgi:hypothetical protein